MVPASGPFKADGMHLNRYPVVGAANRMTPWNIHRLHLNSLPIIDTKAKNLDQWLDNHIGSMMSMRERSVRKKNGDDVLVSLKDTIHALFVRSSGIQGGAMKRAFSLSDSTNNSDTIIFVSDLRYDLHSHTVVCDAYALPLTKPLVQKLSVPLGKLAHSGNLVNFQQDLPDRKSVV